MMRNTQISATALVEDICRKIRGRLPSGWSLEDRFDEWGQISGASAGPNFDGVLALTDPQGLTVNIIVEARARPLEGQQVSMLADRLKRSLLPQGQEALGTENSPIPVVVAPFLGPSARDRLVEAGISYADATGNLRLVSDRPAIFIETEGATRNPWPEHRPLNSLRGGRSGRVVRALLDYRPPFGTRELAALTENSPASVSRVADLLEREAILQRESPRGPVAGVEWERLLRRWAMDYDFNKANRLTPCIAPRGITALFSRLRGVDIPYCVTGSFAAVRYAPVAEPRLAILYVSNVVRALDSLGIRPADSGANVLVCEPFDPVVFERTEQDEGLTYARVTQVAADLMTGPGRGPAEAEALTDWMGLREEMWRLPTTMPTM